MKKMKRFTTLTLLITIEIIVATVPLLGYIPLGFINATTLHLPVIAAGILLGRKEGAIVGFVFGLSSLINNTLSPNITSFLFSPFFSLGGVHGNFASLLIAFLPRMMCGYLAGVIYPLFQKNLNSHLRAVIASILGSFSNTVLVMSGAAVFFAEAYASAQGIAVSSLITFIIGVVCTNGVAECLVAALICPIIVKAFHKVMH
ncbi:MAG: ECF transporter S component [Erysipelotrichaceae bacterium]|nr:ECF transporter S component [Erysipelotrichaceae bacterium]